MNRNQLKVRELNRVLYHRSAPFPTPPPPNPWGQLKKCCCVAA